MPAPPPVCTYKKGCAGIFARAAKKIQFMTLLGVNGNLLAVLAYALKLYGAVDERKQRVVLADAYVIAGVELCSALSYKNDARKHKLPVGALDAEALRLAVAAVVRGAGTFFMCK